MLVQDIENYLLKYKKIWKYVAKKELYEMPCECNTITKSYILDEDDYYGCNFTDNQKIYVLFFTEHSDCFCGIPLFDNDLTYDKMDELPVYQFDLSCEEQPELYGNFKDYFNEILKKYKPYNNTMHILKSNAINELTCFSDKVINKTYTLVTENND